MPEFQGYLIAFHLNDSAMHDSRLAQRSPTDRNGRSTYNVVDQFTEPHDIHGIGLRLAFECKADDPFIGLEDSVTILHIAHEWIEKYSSSNSCFEGCSFFATAPCVNIRSNPKTAKTITYFNITPHALRISFR